MTATAAGFRTLVREQIVVDSLSTVEVDLKLEVGSTTESITVSGAMVELKTADPRMGQTTRNEMYTALPLYMGNGSPRNPASFIYLMPGVQPGGTFGFINGGQSFSKDVYLGGLPITDAVRQGESRALEFAVSVKAIEQFQVETIGQSVFHGSLYEYFRTTVLDARSFFSPTRPQQNHNQFGFTFGGPIVRNKLFFFGAHDGYRYRVATDYRFVTIPTMRKRSGISVSFPSRYLIHRAQAVRAAPDFSGNVRIKMSGRFTSTSRAMENCFAAMAATPDKWLGRPMANGSIFSVLSLSKIAGLRTRASSSRAFFALRSW